jgi:hypothetical protein
VSQLFPDSPSPPSTDAVAVDGAGTVQSTQRPATTGTGNTTLQPKGSSPVCVIL